MASKELKITINTDDIVKKIMKQFNKQINEALWEEPVFTKFTKLATPEELDWFFNGSYKMAVNPINDIYQIIDLPEQTRSERKQQGVCLECGDKGEFRGMACMCRNGHGKIWG